MSADEVHDNPIDDKAYVAPAFWKTHQPRERRPDDPGQKVKTELVRLLTTEAEIAARTDVSDLTAFVREAERLAHATFDQTDQQFRVLVQFTCSAWGHEVQLAHQGDAPQELLDSYYNALLAAKKLQVSAGEVSFQMELSVNP